MMSPQKKDDQQHEVQWLRFVWIELVVGERLQADCCNVLICLEISKEGEEINSEL